MTSVAGPSSSGPVGEQHGPAAQHPDDAPATGDVARSGAQPPSVVPGPPATEDRRVDASLAELAAAVTAPVGDQVAAYVGAHRALHERLTDLDS